MPYVPPPRWAKYHPWLWGILVGAVLAAAWIYFRTRHNALGLLDVIIAVIILCVFTLASGILGKVSPLPDDFGARD